MVLRAHQTEGWGCAWGEYNEGGGYEYWWRGDQNGRRGSELTETRSGTKSG